MRPPAVRQEVMPAWQRPRLRSEGIPTTIVTTTRLRGGSSGSQGPHRQEVRSAGPTPRHQARRDRAGEAQRPASTRNGSSNPLTRRCREFRVRTRTSGHSRAYNYRRVLPVRRLPRLRLAWASGGLRGRQGRGRRSRVRVPTSREPTPLLAASAYGSVMGEQPSDGQVALVSGASRGIGLGIAQALTRAGHRVALVARP